MLYPAELLEQVERVMGIGPTPPAWKAGVLPLNYTRKSTNISKCNNMIPKNNMLVNKNFQKLIFCAEKFDLSISIAMNAFSPPRELDRAGTLISRVLFIVF